MYLVKLFCLESCKSLGGLFIITLVIICNMDSEMFEEIKNFQIYVEQTFLQTSQNVYIYLLDFLLSESKFLRCVNKPVFFQAHVEPRCVLDLSMYTCT